MYAIRSYYADLRRELKTLEIGCGTGFVLNGLKQFPSLKLHGAEVLLYRPAGLQPKSAGLRNHRPGLRNNFV